MKSFCVALHKVMALSHGVEILGPISLIFKTTKSTSGKLIRTYCEGIASDLTQPTNRFWGRTASKRWDVSERLVGALRGST